MLEKSRLYAIHQHKLVNHTYDDKPYSYHLKMENIPKPFRFSGVWRKLFFSLKRQSLGINHSLLYWAKSKCCYGFIF